MLNQDLIRKLQLCSDLPSPHGIALRVIELCQSDTASISEVTAIVSHDPAIASKLLRLANSPLYARRRKFENIRQAVALFGLNGTLALALGFSVVDNASKQQGSLDYNEFWRRSVASAISCSVLAKIFDPMKKEELFLAGLVQDIGMLAIEKISPALYNFSSIGDMHHKEIIELERAELQADHADVGAWLLKSWNYPEIIVSTVASSHRNNQQSQFDRIVTASSMLADLWWSKDSDSTLALVTKHVNEQLELTGEELSEIIEQIGEKIEEAAQIFNIDIEDCIPASLLIEKAKELTSLITVSVIQETIELKKKTDMLSVQNTTLTEQTRRDQLTGLYNRTYLEQALDEEFLVASQNGLPLTVAFIDLDRFKRINDTYGHEAGDIALCFCAGTLQKNLRDSDILARYGGEEFVVILPGTNIAGSQIVCNRILEAFRNSLIPIEGENDLCVTASIGIATLDGQEEIKHTSELLRNADAALFDAKNNGRNQLSVYKKDTST